MAPELNSWLEIVSFYAFVSFFLHLAQADSSSLHPGEKSPLQEHPFHCYDEF